jgi:hypothetical protein
MSDEVDAQLERERPVEQHATRRKEGPAATGNCHACDDPVPAGLRFCGALCRDEYEWQMSRVRAARGFR